MWSLSILRYSKCEFSDKLRIFQHDGFETTYKSSIFNYCNVSSEKELSLLFVGGRHRKTTTIFQHQSITNYSYSLNRECLHAITRLELCFAPRRRMKRRKMVVGMAASLFTPFLFRWFIYAVKPMMLTPYQARPRWPAPTAAANLGKQRIESDWYLMVLEICIKPWIKLDQI